MNVKEAFTLIELIIVVIIVAILAVTAIPRYFANIDKAKKSQVYVNLDLIRQAALAYYAAYGNWPAGYSWPITVTIDGDTIYSIGNPDPGKTSWYYYLSNGIYTSEYNCSAPSKVVMAEKQPGSSCYYSLCTDGNIFGTCTP